MNLRKNAGGVILDYGPPNLDPDRLRLWDTYWRQIWDAATATTPAYQHVGAWVNATIDRADGTRWVGQVYRCAEGIKRFSYEDLTYLTAWPNPAIGGDA